MLAWPVYFMAAAVQLEDAYGAPETQNLPSMIDEHRIFETQMRVPAGKTDT